VTYSQSTRATKTKYRHDSAPGDKNTGDNIETQINSDWTAYMPWPELKDSNQNRRDVRHIYRGRYIEAGA